DVIIVLVKRLDRRQAQRRRNRIWMKETRICDGKDSRASFLSTAPIFHLLSPNKRTWVRETDEIDKRSAEERAIKWTSTFNKRALQLCLGHLPEISAALRESHSKSKLGSVLNIDDQRVQPVATIINRTHHKLL